uniref:Guanine nucleotide-binding protein subunit alpha n=1 Tax=Hirondellea gigas TaxID=1518452 RepID=A0A6A7G7Q2_9CRUS
MGCCASNSGEEEKLTSSQQSPAVSKAIPKETPVYKLLFLGAGESGKSTFFKRMQIRYGRGYTEAERLNYLPVIYENTIAPMKTLIWQSEQLGSEYDCLLRPENQEFAAFIKDLPEDDVVLDQEIAEAVSILWEDPAIKNTFSLRSGFQVQDSADYFFENCMTTADENYVPSETDILRCRDRTTGILEQNFDVAGNLYQVFDVGGQRAERKKWINCFKNVKAVMFVVALSEYDQVCFEDDVTNRLEEAITVFDNVCNSKWFERTPIILLLNKKDLFRQKIEDKRISLSKTFPEYTDEDGDYEAASAFIKNQFVSRNSTNKKIYPYLVCATGDEDEVKNVFDSMTEIIADSPDHDDKESDPKS